MSHTQKIGFITDKVSHDHNHQRLLYKLSQIGVRGNLLKWFQGHLSQRSQCVIVSDECSYSQSVEAGVPQGSTLAPVMFLIYINDIEDKIDSDMFVFVYDTNLLRSYRNAKEAEQFLNNDLQLISSWAMKWHVDFNSKKTIFINFSLKKNTSKLDIAFQGIAVKQVKEHKHLGIVLHETLNWNAHLTFCCNKTSKHVGLLLRKAWALNRTRSVTIDKSMIHSMPENGVILFDGWAAKNNLILEKVQRLS